MSIKGRPIAAKRRTEALDGAVEGLIRGWLERRGDGESFTAFQRRLTDEELGALAGLEPAVKRKREVAA
mgnify:CR=1 FL=1